MLVLDIVDSNARHEGSEQRVGIQFGLANVLEVCFDRGHIRVLAYQCWTQFCSAHQCADLLDTCIIGIEYDHNKVFHRVVG